MSNFLKNLTKRQINEIMQPGPQKEYEFFKKHDPIDVTINANKIDDDKVKAKQGKRKQDQSNDIERPTPDYKSKNQYVVNMKEDEDDIIAEFEQLDEISKQKLGEYIKKASTNRAMSAAELGFNGKDQNALKNYRKRTVGIEKAVDKIVKEDLDESYKEIQDSYHKSAIEKLNELKDLVSNYDNIHKSVSEDGKLYCCPDWKYVCRQIEDISDNIISNLPGSNE